MGAKTFTPNGQLTETLVRLLDGTRLAEKVGVTLLFNTVGESGWSNVALLSVGEVLAVSPVRLQLALWPETRTGANLSRTGKGVLFLIHGGTAYTIEITARRLGDLQVEGIPLAGFTADVIHVAKDKVDYATLTSGVTFQLNQPEEVLPRWEKTLTALRNVPSGT